MQYLFINIDIYYIINVIFNFWFMVYNATFNIVSVLSWRSILLVEETEVNY